MRPSKRDELVEKALELFQNNGFHASGVDRVADHAGMSKTSIYNHFPSKEALIEAALAHQERRLDALLDAAMDGAETPAARLRAIFGAFEAWTKSPGFRGCAFIKAAAEFADRGAEPRRAAEAAKRRLEARLRRELAALGLSPKDRRETAARLMVLAEGGKVRAQMGAAAGFATARRMADEVISEAERAGHGAPRKTETAQ